jgi:ketosteroid isomerase-like protein
VTTEDNVELVRRVTEVMDADGFAAALPVFLEAAHPDVEWQEDPAWPGATSYRGAEQVRKVILDRMDTLDFAQETDDLIGIDDKVVALVRWSVRGRASGADGEMALAIVWTVGEGAITRIEFFLDRARALAETGIAEAST